MKPSLVCPVCSGPKSRKARMCAGCRRRATRLSVEAVGKASVVSRQLTPGQLRAFHAKANDLDRRLGLDRGTAKRDALARAAEQFGRPIESVSELSDVEASWLLDSFDLVLERAS